MNISREEIDRYAFNLGYDRYIPYNFVEELTKALLYRSLGIKYNATNTFRASIVPKLLVLIPESYHHPLTEVILLLKKINKQLNLRAIEYGLSSSVFLEVEQTNYKCSVPILSMDSRRALGIDIDKDYNTVILSDEVQQVIDFYEQLKSCTNGQLFDYSLQTDKLSNYSQAYKCRKYKLASPLYKYLLATKNLIVKSFDPAYVGPSAVTVYIDVSMSTAQNTMYQSLVKSILLLYADKMIDSQTINIVEYHDGINKVLEFDNAKDLRTYAVFPRQSYVSYKDISNMIDSINKVEGHVIVLTDGDDLHFTNKLIKTDLTVISLSVNIKFKSIIVNNGSKYIQVNSNI